MPSTLTIQLPNNVNSEVYVYKENELIVTMKRRFLLGSKIKAEIYQNDTLLVKCSSFLFTLKIEEQNLTNEINIKSHNLFFSEFDMGDDNIVVKSNLLYFLNKKWATISLNSKNVAKVKLKKILDSKGITLELNCFEDQQDKEFEILLSVLLTILHLNI